LRALFADPAQDQETPGSALSQQRAAIIDGWAAELDGRIATAGALLISQQP